MNIHSTLEIATATLGMLVFWFQRRRIKRLEKDLKWTSKRLWYKEGAISREWR